MKSAKLAKEIAILPILIFIVFVVGILLTGFFNYKYHKNRIISEKKSELDAIANLKAEQLNTWKRERIGDANTLKDNYFLSEQIEIFFNDHNALSKNHIQKLLYSYLNNYEYQGISLLDKYGNIQLSVAENVLPDHSFQKSFISKLLKHPEVELISIPRFSRTSNVHLDVVIPILKQQKTDSSFLALIVLHINPTSLFLPMVKTNLSANGGLKALLLEYQSNNIVVLYSSNINKGGQDVVKNELFNTQIIAKINNLGDCNTYEGIDDSNIESIISYSKLPGSPWYLVVLENKKEINKALEKQFILTSLIIGAFILLAGLLTAIWWWYQRILYYRRIYKTEIEHKTLIKKHEFLVKFAYDIIILTDQDLNIIEFNYRAMEVFGYSREEMSVMNIFDLHAPETQSKITDKINILNNEQAAFFETLDKKKDGSLFPIEFSARLFEIDGENYYQFIGRDISDRRKAEEDLDKIFNLVPDMICLASTDGYFKRLNPEWEKTLGFTINELMERPFIEFIHPDDIKATQKEVQKQLKGNETYNFSNRYLCKDGGYRWFEWVAIPSPNGELLFAAARDITARKQAEDERETMIRLLRLLNSRNNLQSLVLSVISFLKEVADCQAVGLRLKDGDDFPYYETLGFPTEFVFSERCLFSLDVQGNKIIDEHGKPVLECYCGDILTKRFDKSDLAYTPYGSFWTNSISEIVEKSIKNTDGIRRRNKCYHEGYESVALIPLHMGGEILGLIQLNDKAKGKFSLQFVSLFEKLCENIAIAITQRRSQDDLIKSNLQIQKINEELIKAKEKAEESDRLKSAFLANMSHEIRTPMNAIIGFTEILLKPDLALEKKDRYAALIRQRSNDLLRIIEDVLDISKIEVGLMKVVETEVNVALLLNELFEYYRLKKEKDETKAEIAIKLLVSPELKNTRIKTDSLRLKQILNNLLDNALKFTQRGSIEFGCKLETNSIINFYVKDTGIGIDPKKHKLIFDPFRQAEDSVFSRQYGGVGLGLSIVKGMVKLMKGKIWLESQPQIGTTFYFSIPYEPIHETADSELNATVTKTSDWKNKIILVVEDDEINSLCINEMLIDTGLKILNAYNGAEAIRIFNNEPVIDLILMDIRLPDTTGLSLTKIIRQVNPKISIIAQTAYASPEDARECLAAGCNDYISKPINKAKLFAAISKYLKEKP